MPQKFFKGYFQKLLAVQNVNSQDDIIVWGKDLHQHNESLKKLFKKIRSHGLKLNKTRCHITINELVFPEDIISKDGIKVDPKMVHAVIIYLSKLTKAGCKSFLGCFTTQENVF